MIKLGQVKQWEDLPLRFQCCEQRKAQHNARDILKLDTSRVTVAKDLLCRFCGTEQPPTRCFMLIDAAWDSAVVEYFDIDEGGGDGQTATT